MAALFGTLQGSRGKTTRCGTKRSGIWARLQTWKTYLIAKACIDNDIYYITTHRLSFSGPKKGKRAKIYINGRCVYNPDRRKG